MLIEPKEITIRNRTYIIHKLPAITGREILAKYPTTLGKIFINVNNYEENKKIMLLLMSFVMVKDAIVNGEKINIVLKDENLINSWVYNWEDLVLLEKEMIEYNFSFFQDGKLLSLKNMLKQEIMPKITEILTQLSQQ